MERLKILGATLPSIEEAKMLPYHLRKHKRWWWLRSPGDYQNRAAGVNFDGSVYYYGDFVNIDDDAVRPALQIPTLESSNLQIGDRFEFGDVEFEVVSNGLAFCVTDIGRCAFREDWRAKDANDYEASDVKRYIDRWYHEAMAKDSLQFEHTVAEERKEQ